MAYPALQLHTTLLSKAISNSVVEVISIETPDSELKNRLLAHGIVPGTKIKVLKKAPLGCPIIISLLGFSLSLRLSEASVIRVTEI